MTQKDPYTTLGVGRNASADDIKKAYRKLAHQHHPDKAGGDEGKFKEINEAYQILSDPKKKANFDNFGFAYNDGGYGGQAGGQDFGGFDFSGFQSGGGFGGMEDLFDMFSGAFGGQQYHQEPSKGEDIYLEIPLSKKDLGQKRIFEFEAFNTCEKCDATGVEPGYKVHTCTTCKGVGQVRQATRTPFGAFSRIAVCPECKGKKKIAEKECSKCKGETRIKTKRKLEIHIPETIEDGYNIIMPKAGNAGPEGKQSGDLMINLKLK